MSYFARISAIPQDGFWEVAVGVYYPKNQIFYGSNGEESWLLSPKSEGSIPKPAKTVKLWF
ncbi:MAG TPA: hypothetical protein VK211_09585 [Kamptonema sp.]|nr:hypothetical protein [Kamptonema sp.]